MDSSEKNKKVQESCQDESVSHSSKCDCNDFNSPPVDENSTPDLTNLNRLIHQMMEEGQLANATRALLEKKAQELAKELKIFEQAKRQLYSLAKSVDQRYLLSEQNMVALRNMRIQWEKDVEERAAAIRARKSELDARLEIFEVERAQILAKEKCLSELEKRLLEEHSDSTRAENRLEEHYDPQQPESSESSTEISARKPGRWTIGKSNIGFITHRSLLWMCIAANAAIGLYLFCKVS